VVESRLAAVLTLWRPYTIYIPVTNQILQVSCWMLLAGALILLPDRSARRHTY
jgi:hypothetical protein